MTDNHSEQVLQIVDNGPLRWLILNRPAKMNALNRLLAETLIDALDKAENTEAVKVVAVTGNGNAFCSGADLHEFQACLDAPESGFLEKMAALHAKLRTVGKPTIAVVNGLACAGGLELVLCCDLVIAEETAKLGDAHANYGAFPGGGGASLLPRRIGLNRAKRLLYSGELLAAPVWYDWGLVTTLATGNRQLREKTEALALDLATKNPLILREMKRVANLTESQSAEECLREEMRTLKALCASSDLREGFAAFKEKRQPRFTGK